MTIKGKEHEGKCTFLFDTKADEKYNEPDAKGNKPGGFLNIYTKLMNDDFQGVLAFWDCAAANYGKERPSVLEIQNTLQELIDDEEADTDKLFADAFKAIHNSGFYKKKARKYWERIEKMQEMGETKEEKQQNKEALQTMVEKRDELLE
ncbi:tail assembly chaperone [Planococcus koreensis]|uniref:tail assembly chaperone n=1 Tax=Planococcus koreensis TaxID=112331 RepID=UPI0039FD5928